MKAFAKLTLLLVLLFCISPFCMAQDSANCSQLQREISELENLDIKPMTPSLRQLYKESLLTLYTEISQCIQQDIAATANMRKAAAGTNTAPAVENKLRALRKKKKDTDGKILILRTVLNLNLTGPPRDIVSESLAPEAVENPSAHRNAAEPSRDIGSESSSPEGAENPSAQNRNPTAPSRGTDSEASSPEATENPSGPPANSSGVSSVASLTAPPSPQASPSCELPVNYPDPPLALSDIADKAAADVVKNNKSDRSIAPIFQMMLYTIFDAASPTSSKMVRELPSYEYLSETARTDKQLGASAKSDGAVSTIEKPGFAQLLGFAVEHGGITKKNDGTNLTLSSSLYSLYTMNTSDTAENYARAGILNRVGVAASFAIDNKDNELANARRNNLSEWSLKARLFGDRSTRSANFQRFWNEKVRPLISLRLQALGSAVDSLATRISNYDDIEKATKRCLPELVGKRMLDADYIAATDEAKQKIISDLILAHLRSNVFDRIESGSLKLDAKDISNIEQEFIPRLKGALDNLVLADAEIREEIDQLNKGPLGTFAYTNHRIPTGSDYSEAKFLYEQDKGFMGPLKLTGNLGLSLYNNPNPALNQQRLRDVSAALSFEGSAASPFVEAENQSKITYSFVGRYERMFENRRMANRKSDIGVLQFVGEIPFFKGLSLPLSVTYSNATEEEKKQGFRFNFGMRLDMDKLFALLNAGSNQ